MIPKTNYPNSIDSNQTLFSVADGLRVILSEDYNPGDTSISVFGDEEVMRSFDATGIITLTEQCSEPELRALSFYYSSRTLDSFDGLELLPGFIDNPKPKRVTNVTQNVMSIHHNNLKDALIKIERFAGKRGEVGKYPLRGTMEERINYLRKLVLSPRAWFKVDKVVGLSPLTVEFTNQSFYLGTDSSAYAVKHLWDFGDNTNLSEISVISVVDSVVPPEETNILADVSCPTSGLCKVQKTYSKPGIYDVKLTVTNDFGLYEVSDTVVFPGMINVKYPAPDTATIDIVSRSGQLLIEGSPSGVDDSKPYTSSTPKIRASINSLIDVKIKDEKVRPDKPGSYTDSNQNEEESLINRRYTGEIVDGDGNPIDKIVSYTWSFSDDLVHSNSPNTKALFGIGGYFDLVLRVDTEFKSYRITTYKNAFDIIENYNLWLWYKDSTSVFAYEFGIISETFKVKGNPATVTIDSSFLDSLTQEQRSGQAKKEFLRNNGCSKRGSVSSGDAGTALLYYASGRSPTQLRSEEKIKFLGFNGFTDTHFAVSGEISRPWNWIGLSYNQYVYVIFGSSEETASTPQVKHTIEISSSPSSVSSASSTITTSNLKNGAVELLNNTMSFQDYDSGVLGYHSVYRSAWHSDSGYFLRNEGGAFYRISSFYKTSGNSAESFVDIKRLTDMPGSRVEGQMVSLSQGLYFFNNSGSVLAYGPNSGVWTSGGPGSNSASFRALQDTSQVGFDDVSQTFIATSDDDKIAYLSYDYSNKSFIKFNEAEITFKSITNASASSTASVSPEREDGVSQWQMYIF